MTYPEVRARKALPCGANGVELCRECTELLPGVQAAIRNAIEKCCELAFAPLMDHRPPCDVIEAMRSLLTDEAK